MKIVNSKSFVLALALVMMIGATLAHACPMCSDSLPNEADAQAARDAGLPDNPSGASSPQLAEGFYYSILFMLVIPYALLGAGGVVVYLKLKKGAAADQDRINAARPSEPETMSPGSGAARFQ